MENSEKQKPIFIQFMEKYGHYIVSGLVVLGILMLFLPTFSYVINKGNPSGYFTLANYFKDGFKFGWTMFINIGLLIVAVILLLLKEKEKFFLPIATFLIIFGIILLAISKSFLELSFGSVSIKYTYGFYISIAFLTIAAFFSLSMSYDKDQMSVRDIAEEGVLVAMAFILNLITLFKAPTGGSVNLQMLPLFLLALRHGPTHGLIAGGIVYGLITCATDGYGFACYPFDYLIGFGSIAVVGGFQKLVFNKYITNDDGQLTKGFVVGELALFAAGLLSTLVRYIGSTASSVIVWEMSLTEGLIYNSIYVPVSGGIAIVASMLLLPAIVKLNKEFPVKHSYWL